MNTCLSFYNKKFAIHKKKVRIFCRQQSGFFFFFTEINITMTSYDNHRSLTKLPIEKEIGFVRRARPLETRV